MNKEKHERLLFTDITRCMACHSCELACAVAHSASRALAEAIQEEPRASARLSIETADGTPVPLQCRHCEDAPCVAICPTSAIEKLGPNQPVILHEERCIGCKFCVVVCPFGVMTLRRDGKVALKCDLCIERLDAGEDPACVSACPTGALHFESLDAWLVKRRKAAAREVKDAEGKAEKVRSERK